MPLSHLSLTVSDLDAATMFYLAALKPLGYRYFGQRGSATGLGIQEADFFLSQADGRAGVSPTHVAFTAEHHLAVRDCYTAALKAGAHPSGAPSYREGDCDCFNSAVVDPDGHTIEFIYRQPHSATDRRTIAAPPDYSRSIKQPRTNKTSTVVSSEYSRSVKQPSTVARKEMPDYTGSLASFASKAQSTAKTALDLASSASKSTKSSSVSNPGISRSKTEPVQSFDNNGGNAVVGTLLGAAAGAALAYVMVKSERENAADEEQYIATMRSKAGSARVIPDGSTTSKRSARHHESTLLPRDSQYTPRSMPAIECRSYDDIDVGKLFGRFTSFTRPALQRSRTFDAIEYKPRSNSSGHNERFSIKRASTMPLDYGEDHKSSARFSSSSRHTGRRQGVDDTELERHDSAVSVRSHRSRRSSADKTSASKRSKKDSQYKSAANVPLPPSRAESYVTADEKRSRTSKSRSHTSAAKVPLPPSRATSYISAAQVSIPQSYTVGGYSNILEEPDGLSDMESVKPDDSISCVDFSTKSKKSSKHSSTSKSSRHTSKKSEADSDRTVRPPKPSGASRHSAQTMPMKSKDDYRNSKVGRRSTATYA